MQSTKPHTLQISDQLSFDGYISGDPKNPLVILLHGFPETAHMWLPLMDHLSSNGYYCFAPNTRGLSAGARTKSREDYAVNELAKDVMDIADALSSTDFHLIGHDWGAAIGWQVAANFVDEIKSYTALSIPHLQPFGEAIVNDEKQAKMSAYMRRFKIPWLAEWMLKRNNYKLLRKIWRESSEEQVEAYLSIFKQKGAISAALNYYRTNYETLIKAAKATILGKIEVPTLFIWGKNDFAIGPVAVRQTKSHMSGPYTFLEVDGGHWLMQTNFEDIKDPILKHLNANPG